MTSQKDRYTRAPAPLGTLPQAAEPAESPVEEGVDDLRPFPAPPLGTGQFGGAPSEATSVESPAAKIAREAAVLGPENVDTPGLSSLQAKRPTTASRPDKPEERLGQVLGSYRLLDVIGKGGMGAVYRAEHIKLGRTVALKLLRPDFAERKDSVARFFQEARAVNRVRHRNIVDVTDLIELENGLTFIIMEILTGYSLGKWARSGFELPRAIALFIQICDGLAAAHAVGIVHRDLKPDNIFVVPTMDGAEQIKILDFGIAKLLYREEEDYGLETAVGAVIGTPAFMSPEQAGGMEIDHRSDIYSLGAIIYEVMCGQPMFRAKSFGEYVRKHLNELPVPPRQTQMGQLIDERLEALIMRCLAKRRDDRYSSAMELRSALLSLTGESSRPAVVLPNSNSATLEIALPSVEPHALTPALELAEEEVFTLRPTVGKKRWMAVGAGAVAVLAGAFFVFGSSSGVSAPTAGTSTPGTVAEPAAPTLLVESMAKTPTAVADKPRRPAAVMVRFVSEPRAELYAEGESTARCTTPCDLSVDTGGAASLTFTLRKAGYVSAPIVIETQSPSESVFIALTKESAGRPVHGSSRVAKPSTPGSSTPHATGSHGSASTGTDSSSSSSSGTKSPTTTPPADQAGMTGDTPSPVKNPPKDVAPTDTLDPFGGG